MSAICNSKKLLVILSALLALVVMLSFMTVPALAEDTTSQTESTEAETGTESDTSAGADTTADSTAESTADTSADTSVSTETETSATTEVDHTKGIINLVVGGVLLVAIAVLAFVFRHKIPGWYKDVKSECKKIVWCPKDKLRKNSLVVVVIILAVTVVIGLLDFAFSDGIILLGKLFG